MTASEHDAKGCDKRLLVVDDNPEMSEIVRLAGCDLGYEVHVASHGKDFMRLFDSINPTTIVLDIVMPDIDGFELIKWLQDRGCKAHTIVASAANPDYARLAETFGAAKGLEISWIQKPYSFDELRRTLALARDQGETSLPSCTLKGDDVMRAG